MTYEIMLSPQQCLNEEGVTIANAVVILRRPSSPDHGWLIRHTSLLLRMSIRL
jgi:hypothetical protein